MKKTSISLLRSCFAALLLSIAPVISAAEADYDFEYDGYYFNILSPANLTCVLKKLPPNVSPDLVIPSTAMFENKTLTVQRIDAKLPTRQFNTLTIPSAVKEIVFRVNDGFFSFSNGKVGMLIFEDSDTPLDVAYVSDPDNFYADNDYPFRLDVEKCYIGRPLTTSIANYWRGSIFVSSLKEAVIGDKIKSVSKNLFFEAISLEKITFGKSVSRIEDRAFENCWMLHEVILPENLVSIGNSAFASCGRLESCRLPESVAFLGKGAFSGSGLTSISISGQLREIPESAFSWCSALHSIDIPDNIETVGEYAFMHSGLKHISIGTGVVKIESNAFSGTGATIVNVKKTDPPKITKSEDGSPFSNKSYLGVLNVPKGAKEKYEADYGWNNFIDIREVDEFEPWDGSGDDTAGDFTVDGKMYSVISMEDHKVGYRGGIISGRIEIPWEVTYKTYTAKVAEIVDFAFKDCEEDAIIEIPKNIEAYWQYAFGEDKYAINPMHLIIRDADYALKRIGEEAPYQNIYGFRNLPFKSIYIGRPLDDKDCEFGANDHLTKVSFGGGFKKFPDVSNPYYTYHYAFKDCKSIREVNSMLTIPPDIPANMFEPIVYVAAVLNVPRGAAAAYRAAEGWKEFYTINEVDEFDVDKGSVESVSASPVGTPTVTVSGFEITVSGQDAGSLEVYGSNGMLVYAGTATTVTVPGRGLYIVRVGNRAVKVAVR